MDSIEIEQIKTLILRYLFRNIDKKNMKYLRQLADEKNVQWLSPALEDDLNSLMSSIIRHRDTDYNNIVTRVGKDQARFYVTGLVNDRMEQLKGVAQYLRDKKCKYCSQPLVFSTSNDNRYRISCSSGLTKSCKEDVPTSWAMCKEDAVRVYEKFLESKRVNARRKELVTNIIRSEV